MNLADNLVTTAKTFPDRPAVRLDDTTWTYAQLDEKSAQVAGFLRAQGIQPGDRVALQLPNFIEFPAIYYGILRAGAVVVPMNPLLKEREVDYYMSNSGAKLLVDSASAPTVFGSPNNRADFDVTDRSDE